MKLYDSLCKTGWEKGETALIVALVEEHLKTGKI